MSTRTYYLDVDGGILDTDIAVIRRKAMDHLQEHQEDGFLTVYTSASMKVEVGCVVIDPRHWSKFTWIKSNGRSRPINEHGYVYKHKTSYGDSIPDAF